MEIQKILKEFTQKCWDELDLSSIIQFGSSTYSNNPCDIDLMFISNSDIFSSNDILKLMRIISFLEKKYSNVVIDFTGLNRKRVGEYIISVIFLGKKELNVIHNPHDIIFFKGFSKDENKKILFGKDLFKNLKINITTQHLFEALTVNQKHALRKCLDDELYRLNSSYELFKSTLRLMLINEKFSKKEDLPMSFENKFGNKIKLPKDSERILSNRLKKEDFENILRFSEDCLKYLVENK